MTGADSTSSYMARLGAARHSADVTLVSPLRADGRPQVQRHEAAQTTAPHHKYMEVPPYHARTCGMRAGATSHSFVRKAARESQVRPENP